MTLANVIGNVGGTRDASVDRSGAVQVRAGWSLDWWVGASDRWHHPAEESGTTVTQRRIEGLPIVETAMRVPRGQVLSRAWCVAAGGGDVAVVELENRSQEPVALAMVLRGAGRVAFDGERAVSVDGRPAMVLGRRPARTRSGDDPTLRAALAAGEGDAPARLDVRGSAAVAFVFPLAHTARLRIAVPLDAAPVPADLDALADHEAVARGSRGHIDAGVRIGVPDEQLVESVVGARTTLLLRADRARTTAAAAVVGSALGAWGHHDAAAVAMASLPAGQRSSGRFGRRRDADVSAAVLAAWGTHARATGDTDWAEPLAGPAAKAAHRLAKDGVVAPWAQRDAADVLDAAGQPDAAALCRQRAASATAARTDALPDGAVSDGAVTDDDAAEDDAATAAFLLATRARFVDDTTPEELVLLPAFPDDWLGRDVEAHRLPTRAGLLSFAVRWHGPRPALLWELDSRHEAVLRCPALDPGWSSTDPVGEALLGLVEPAGGLPKVVAPLVGGTPADDAPAGGGSFR